MTSGTTSEEEAVRTGRRSLRDVLVVDRPVPFNIRNQRGVLLLAKGQTVTSEAQLELLVTLASQLQFGDVLAAMPDSGSTQRTLRLPAYGAASTRLVPAQTWPALHEHLSQMLRAPQATPTLATDLQLVQATAALLLERERDESLYALVQMLCNPAYAYCATNALVCAALCYLTAPSAKLTEDTRHSVVGAAMTMNVGMADLQDRLSRETEPLTRAQKLEIANHPTVGAEWLADAGIRDLTWLQIVANHHTPQPRDRVERDEVARATELLRLADLFVARVAPRSSRAGLSPHAALRRLYLEMQAQVPELVGVLVKHLGIFPPGSRVKLASGETAIVKALGEKLNQPQVMAVLDSDGRPKAEPVLRDTRLEGYTVQESLPADRYG